jgi:RNA polymerase sigma-70 factor (ECF subfamily)
MPAHDQQHQTMTALGVTASERFDVDDTELVQRAASGDQAAFVTIMRQHNRALYRAARSITQDDAEAEDAVQETYVRAYQALSGFRADATLRTWLTRIVINQAFERLRKRRREVGTTSADNIVDLETHLDASHVERSVVDTPERSAMRAEMRRLLEAKIDELPAAYRTVFMLRGVEELTVEETAECLGIPSATVRTRFFRARALLRQSLATEVTTAFDEAFAFAGERCDRIVRCVLQRIESRA